MKKIQQVTLALMTLLFFSTASFAQTQKGNLMVGSSLTDFGFNFQNSVTEFHFNLQPKIAYFVRDGLALGGYVNFGLSTASGAGTATNYGVGALARYYPMDKNLQKLEFSKRARFFVEANAGFGGTNLSGDAGNASTNGLELGIGPGVSYFITPNVALEGALKYNVQLGFGSSVTAHQLGVNVGFQIFLPTAKAREIMREEQRK